MPKRMPVFGRWWEKVDLRDPDECWLWMALRDKNGYGKFQVPTPHGQRHIRAHRWILEHLYGPIPDGMVVMHTCDNPPCVNPRHLRVGTPIENNDDKVAKGRHAKVWGRPLSRARQTHCKHGHPFDDDNTYVTSLGHRMCKTCHRLNALRRYYLRKTTPGQEEVTAGRGDG